MSTATAPRQSAAELIRAGNVIQWAVAALVEYSWAAGRHVDQLAEVPVNRTLQARQLCNVRIDSEGWLKADDCWFEAVTGNPCTVAVQVRFLSGEVRVVRLADASWEGVPFTPEGGRGVVVAWPAQGIAKLT